MFTRSHHLRRKDPAIEALTWPCRSPHPAALHFIERAPLQLVAPPDQRSAHRTEPSSLAVAAPQEHAAKDVGFPGREHHARGIGTAGTPPRRGDYADDTPTGSLPRTRADTCRPNGRRPVREDAHPGQLCRHLGPAPASDRTVHSAERRRRPVFVTGERHLHEAGGLPPAAADGGRVGRRGDGRRWRRA